MKTFVLIIGVVIAVGVWFGLSTVDGQSQTIDKLEEKVKKQEEQISYLQNSKREQTKISQQTDNSKMRETVRVFIHSFFRVKEANYEERKSNAEVVVTQDLFEKQFAKDNPPDQLLYEHDVSDLTVYLSQKDKSAYVVFDQEVTNLANDESNHKRLTIQVMLQQEGEEWLVNGFKQINAEPL